MGQEIADLRFTEADYQAFVERLSKETRRLAEWEAGGGFLEGPTTVGYELEACLVDRDYRPADANEEFLQRLGMTQVVPELARCNIEFNGNPCHLAGDGLHRIQAELDGWLKRAREVAQGLGLRVVLIGILPTLRETDLSLGKISDLRRYYAINNSLARLRGKEQVCIHIRGPQHEPTVGSQEYHGEFDSIMAESAATSFQVHIRLPAGEAAQWYNAALLVSAPVLAVSANSPYLFGHDLWAETRIPVFAQSVDTGKYHYVTFGQDYLQSALSELFERNLRNYPPLLPVCMDEPGLPHLKLHNGTVWRWNRAIVDGDENVPGSPGQALHYRLEHRSLPSGPSVPDMVANAALFWGLAAAMSAQAPAISFRQARRNFYRAARDGMAARLLWVDGREYPAVRLLSEILLPIARDGLMQLDVDTATAQHYLQIIRQRVARGLSGAGWQRAWLRRHGGDEAAMLAAYEAHQRSGLPVAEWPI